MPSSQTTSTAPRRLAFGRVRQERSGRWSAAYLHRGALYRALATFPTKTSAQRWLEDERDLIELDRRNLGAWTPPADRAAKAVAAKLTLREYATRWLEQRDLAPHTRRSYDQALRLAILPDLGDKVLNEITAEDIRVWYVDMGDERATRRARAYGVLTAVLNTAVDDGLIDRSPARIKGGTAVKRTKRSVVLLEPAELAALANALPEELALTVLIAGWCGLRRAEVFALTRADIAGDGSTLRINKSVSAYGRKIEVGPTKTRESNRVVTVPTHIRSAVVNHLANYVGKPKAALLFVDPETGSHLTEGRYRPYFFAARMAIDREDLHFHDLRHFGGVMAALAGGTTKEVMDRLGHTTSSAAMRYQHVAAGRADALADRMSALATPAGGS